MTPERVARIRQVLDTRQPDLRVATDDVHKGQNLAAIVRSCDAFGVGQLHAVLDEETYCGYRGTARGSQKWVTLHHHTSIDDALGPLRADGFQIVAAHFTEQAIDYRQINYTRPTVLLMGNERTGVSAAGQALTDHFVTVPMIGMVESFNVSVACALILNEAYRQREQAGFFAQSRLPQEQWQTLFFQWCQPKLAELCERYQLPYPALSEGGELMDPIGWNRWLEAELARRRG